jgi:hypothetical protein
MSAVFPFFKKLYYRPPTVPSLYSEDSLLTGGALRKLRCLYSERIFKKSGVSLQVLLTSSRVPPTGTENSSLEISRVLLRMGFALKQEGIRNCIQMNRNRSEQLLLVSNDVYFKITPPNYFLLSSESSRFVAVISTGN